LQHPEERPDLDIVEATRVACRLLAHGEARRFAEGDGRVEFGALDQVTRRWLARL